MRSKFLVGIIGMVIVLVIIISSIVVEARSASFSVNEDWCVGVPFIIKGWEGAVAVDSNSFYAVEYGDVGDGYALVAAKVVNGSVLWSRILYRDSVSYMFTAGVNRSSEDLWVALYNSSALVICGNGKCWRFGGLDITTGYGVLSVYGRYVVVGIWDKLFVFDSVSDILKEYDIGMHIDSAMSNVVTVKNVTHIGICSIDGEFCRIFSVSGFNRITKFLVNILSTTSRYYVIGRVEGIRGVAVLDSGFNVVLSYKFNLTAYSVMILTPYGPLGLGINPKGYYGTYIVSNRYPVVVGIDKGWVVFDCVEDVVYSDKIDGYNVDVVNTEPNSVKVMYVGDTEISPIVRSPSSVTEMINEPYSVVGGIMCKYTIDLMINYGSDGMVLGGEVEPLEYYYLLMPLLMPIMLAGTMVYKKRRAIKSSLMR